MGLLRRLIALPGGRSALRRVAPLDLPPGCCGSLPGNESVLNLNPGVEKQSTQSKGAGMDLKDLSPPVGVLPLARAGRTHLNPLINTVALARCGLHETGLKPLKRLISFGPIFHRAKATVLMRGLKTEGGDASALFARAGKLDDPVGFSETRPDVQDRRG